MTTWSVADMRSAAANAMQICALNYLAREEERKGNVQKICVICEK